LLTAGVAFIKRVFATGFPIAFAVNDVTAHVPLAAELTMTTAGFEPADLALCAFAVSWAAAPAENTRIAHNGSAAFTNKLLIEKFARIREDRSIDQFHNTCRPATLESFF
jgi:hypothetical protein